MTQHIDMGGRTRLSYIDGFAHSEFLDAAVHHLAELFKTGWGELETDGWSRIRALESLWDDLTPEQKYSADAWLCWMFDWASPMRCPMVDAAVRYGPVACASPRLILMTWGYLPRSWEFYFGRHAWVCSSCDEGLGSESGICQFCGSPLMFPADDADIVTEALDIGLDLMETKGGPCLLEINGSNYGLNGYREMDTAFVDKSCFFASSYPSDFSRIRKSAFRRHLALGDPPHLAMLRSVYGVGLGLDDELASKWDQRRFHPHPLTSIRSGQRKGPLLNTGHAHYILKPVGGCQGKGIRVVSRGSLVVPRGYVAEPLLEPKGVCSRVMRTGIRLVVDQHDVLHVYHVASYWRRNKKAFDPGDLDSVVTNLSRDAIPELATPSELDEMWRWVGTWSEHMRDALDLSRVELHTNFDKVKTQAEAVLRVENGCSLPGSTKKTFFL